MATSCIMEAAQAPLPSTSAELILAGVAAVLFLALALATSSRHQTSPLAFDVGIMCVAMSSYNIFEVAYSLTHNARWAFLEYAAASLSAIPTLRMFVGYVGQRRRHRRGLQLATVYFVMIAGACVAPYAHAAWSRFPGGALWAGLMLLGMLPTFGTAGYLLWRHAVRSNRDERARVRLLAGALVLGVGGVVTDLAAMAGSGLAPRLSAAGLVVAAALISALILRAPILSEVRVVTLVNAGLAAAIAVLAQLAVVTWMGDSTALLTVGTVVVVLSLVAVVRPLYATLADERARLEESATLGRFAQQMAHDVRNPLAAIVGAAQFLLEEQDQGRPLEPHRAFVELIIDRAERLERVIADYQRLGRVEAEPSKLDINTIVQEALAGVEVGSHGDVTFVVDLAAGIPACSLDHDLFLHALENVLRNAVEALDGKGRVQVTTTVTATAVVVRIADEGPGMDPRTVERAFDAFYTTKVGGTGLGLAFVRRVLEAHDGTARIETQVGQGTSVLLELPLPS